MTDTSTSTRDQMIQEAMTLFGVDRETATFMVRQGLGEITGDIVGLSPDERRALGLDQPLNQSSNQEESTE